MTAYFETKGWHPGLTNGGAKIDAETVEAICSYWSAGEKPNTIATKCGVSRSTVVRTTYDMAPQKPQKRLTAAEISELLRGW